jgi:hypothetical protein
LLATAYKFPTKKYRFSGCVDQEAAKQQKILQVDAQQTVADKELVGNAPNFKAAGHLSDIRQKNKSFKYKALFLSVLDCPGFLRIDPDMAWNLRYP